MKAKRLTSSKIWNAQNTIAARKSTILQRAMCMRIALRYRSDIVMIWRKRIPKEDEVEYASSSQYMRTEVGDMHAGNTADAIGPTDEVGELQPQVMCNVYNEWRGFEGRYKSTLLFRVV